MAMVAGASIPGSIEARLIHGCTCAAGGHGLRVRGLRAWRPELVAEWQGVISLGCPAHGRLLEAYVMRSDRHDSGVRRLGEPVGPVMHKLQRRSLLVRIGYAVRGWLASW
jgi:hypothetical protein